MPLTGIKRVPQRGVNEDSAMNARQLTSMNSAEERGTLTRNNDFATEVDGRAGKSVRHPITMDDARGRGRGFPRVVGNAEVCGSGPRCRLSLSRSFKRTRR